VQQKGQGNYCILPLAQGRLSDKFAKGIPENSRLYGRTDYNKSIGLEKTRLLR
jgi:aryl-alcohol dehydrogenase-like predicted oxidoreductase